MESNKVEKSFKQLVGKSLLEVPDRNFTDKVMDKVVFAQSLKHKRDKNLKLSWFFLAISALLFPAGYLSFPKSVNFEFLNKLDANLQQPEGIFMPALILIFAIIILLQIDNLFRLTFRRNLV